MSARGLARLKRRYRLAPVSNGNISLMVDLARRNDFPWDAILGAEIAGDYKPKPRVYLAAAEAFDLAPQDCMMVAAHSSDLKAAAALGLRTGHVSRPNESGPGTGEVAPKIPVDVAVKSFEELAENSACERRQHGASNSADAWNGTAHFPRREGGRPSADAISNQA